MTLIEKLSAKSELIPDKHDGSYELVRETVKALSTVNKKDISIVDLDLLYLMSVGTWKQSFAKKKEKVDESNLSLTEKSRLKAVIDKLKNNADNHLYENIVGNSSIGMFGTGFYTFKGKSTDADAKRFITFCIEIMDIEDEEKIFAKTEELLKDDIKGMGVASVSQVVHCLKPFIFPVINGGSEAGLQAIISLGVDLIKPKDLTYYAYNARKIRDFRNKHFKFKNYRVLDMALWDSSSPETDYKKNYWLFNVYIKAKEAWEFCKVNDCFAMQYEYGKQDNASVTRNINVAKEVRVGDFVVAYTGDQKIVALGEVIKEFYEETDKGKYVYVNEGWAQRIGVEWHTVVTEPVYVENFIKNLDLLEPNKLANQAINKISEKGYDNAVKRLNSDVVLIDSKELIDNYWWLNAKPSIWSFDNISVGETIEYTSHTDDGTKRKVYKYFDEAKTGDIVLGYETTPTKAIVAICKVAKEHDGKTILFEKVKKLDNPIGLDAIREINDLMSMESLHQPIGSFFKVKPNEFEILMELIDNQNPIEEVSTDEYTKTMFLSEVFFSDKKYEEILLDLDYKKNIILQGPPGVGKTFVAKRLAYSRMGKKDDSKIQMIQFHQSYSYEDFIQGFRPTEDGKFKLKNGIFYEFCRKAQRDSANDYYFIIDEINRGNLSKIFGELMMLIEADKRGKEFAIPLTYAQNEEDKFYIPENLYLIGTMNTADRSLAMVDYALRRRFSFINIEPAFNTNEFRKYLLSKGLDTKLLDKIVQRIGQLNEQICTDRNLGKGYQIGHSYFCCTPKNGVSQEAWYQRIIMAEIRSLLYEYWFDDEETAELEVNKLL